MKIKSRQLLCLSFLFSLFNSVYADDRFEYDPTYELIKWERQAGRTCSSKERRLMKQREFFGDKGWFCRDYIQYKGVLESSNPLNFSPYHSQFQFFQTLEPGRNPLVFIIPVIDGVTLVEKNLAKWFAANGVNALIAENPEDISDVLRPVEDIDGFLIRTTVSLRVLLDFASELPFVDEQRFGAFGGSLGAIRLFTVMGVDERFGAGALFVGGGNIPEILSRSEVGIISKYREAKIQQLNLEGGQEYLDLLNSVVTVEPLDNAHNIDPTGVMMVLSSKDRSVPTKNQLEAMRAVPTDNLQVLPLGHVVSVISSLFYRKKILDFFNGRWEEKDSI